MSEKEWVSATVTLPLKGASCSLELKVPGWPVKPQVMLPVLHQLANTIANFAEQDAAKNQQKISCHKGCAACCRQPVPLTEVEIYFMSLLVAQQPEPRRSELQRRFNTAAAHFQETGWLEAFIQCNDEEAFKGLVRAYMTHHVDCPFLEDECCTIHPYRPVGCREFLVTSDPAHCGAETDADVRRLPMATTVLDGLSKMARIRQLPGNKAWLPMIFALAWAHQFPESYPEKTGVEWLAEFCGQ
jgi:Fe-S-cluster containining protein